MGDIVSPLLNLVPFLLGQLEKEVNISAEAEEKFQRLKESIEDIELFLKKANSMEVITEDLKVSVKRARKFLYVCEDAIDAFTRRPMNSTRESFISVLYNHYKRRNFDSEARHILQKRDNYIFTINVESGDALSSSAGHLSSSIAYSDRSDKFLVGIDQPKKDLVRLICKPERPKAIFVHGPRGVGKTSLVGAALRDEGVKLLCKYYVWIEDLGSCELSAAALMEANTKMWDLSSAEKKNPQDHKLKEAFEHIEKDTALKEKSWALVMDDASRVNVFMYLESHLNRTCPIVLVTTRVRSLQSSSVHFFKSIKAEYISYEFECVLLTKKDSRSLFQKNIHQENIHGDVYECILEKFSGLPLEILATCELLNRRRPSATGALYCASLSGSLGDELLSSGYEGGPIRRKRAPRTDPLLDVRACLFYLSVFPLKHPIRCSTMMRLWMAERFIKQKGAQTVQEKAEETLERLLDHYEILEKEKTSYGKVKTCGLPPIWHQQIISESVDQEIAMIVDRPDRPWPENIWHLSIHGDMDITDRWLEHLLSLLVFNTVHYNPLQDLLMKAKRLKVLDLQSYLTEQEKNDRRLSPVLPEIFKLKYLRYLSLRGSWVKDITGEMINHLTYLETLDLRDTLVYALPELQLKALRHLLISKREAVESAPVVGSARVESARPKLKIIRIWRSCAESLKRVLTRTNRKLGVKASSNLGDLTSLQKLCMIEVEPVEREEWLNKLGKLINLQKLGLSKLKDTDWKPLCLSIQKLTKLVVLHLIAAEGQKIVLSERDGWKAHEFLQRVHLTGHLEISPDWNILPRHRLVKLVLKGSLLETDPLRQLGDFPCLKHLELENAFDFHEIKFEEGKFEKLCFLGLSNFGELKSIRVLEKALWSLERLYIDRCTSLREVPDLITLLIRKFKCLEYCEMHDEFGIWARQLESSEAPADMKVESLIWNGPIRVVENVRGAEGQGGPIMREHLEKSSP
ncbi:hypothetical protein EUGRSUZ_E01281 [Eucalyptus grandis]|uniref:Uncharacterized protein n=2 Tax=Eucalyptus grandis TaxID=71139 RepID=A0ACC3KU02_EUCGR|nr:hypothetical protein EUGRSUZ_E01281 [Eucalyptus grandis]